MTGRYPSAFGNGPRDGRSTLERPPTHAARYQVDRAHTVADACSDLEAYSYDLVIADTRLSDGTGMNVADRAG